MYRIMKASKHSRRVVRLLPAIAVMAASLFAAACATYPDVDELEQLKRREPAKPFYHELLALQYEQLAVTEADFRGNREAARFYAVKGNKAADGEDVPPESPTDASGQREAHERLITYRDNELDIVAPALLARAQGSYDCWVEESRQGRPELELAPCRDGFELAAASLDRELPPVPLGELSPDYTLFFDAASIKVPDDAAAVLDEIVAAVEAGQIKGLRIVGHSDRVGDGQANLRLSDERARSVVAALETAGVPRQIMRKEAFGETELLVETPDGVPEAKNRRVEIYLDR